MLIFDEGLELPAFAAFDLLKDEAGTETLRRYYAPYVAEAASRGLGFVAESPTWRASPRWARELGYDASELDAFNRRAIALMEELRAEHPLVVISGCVGPSDDGYNPAAAAERRRGRGLPLDADRHLRRHRRRHGHGDHDDLRGGGDRGRAAPPCARACRS